MVDIITKHIDVWTSAQITKNNVGRGSNGKQTAYGIKKLRELILELAVRGKLVPQDPNDEPACVLLEKIAAEKARLVKEGKITNQKPLSKLSEEEKLYELPIGWEWIRLTDLYYSISPSGKKLKSSEISETGLFPVVDQGKAYIAGYTDESDLLIEIPGPVIVFGDHTTERKYIDFDFVAGADGTKILRPYKMDERYFYTYLLSYNLENRGYARHFKVLNDNKVALPPLAEQHRIVAKVDELMALCDQLEQQQTNSNAAHQTLVETLLGTLTNTADQNEFATVWQRITEHFDTLFTTEHSIDQLKQTILQLAVMGKLVPQDPNDEPANELLKKITEEKAQLIKEGKTKKQKPLPEISEAEKPFKLPVGWSFVRLEKLSNVITKGSSPKWQGVSYTENPGDVLFITSENVGSYVLMLDSKKYVEEKFNEIEPRSILKKGDFLMNIVGASIGRTAIYNVDDLANINQAVCLIRLASQLINSQFLLHFFNCEICISYMFDKQVDNARANLSMGNIAKFVIPIPPFKEQQRIVAKVNELMALCDALKSSLNEAQTTQIHLADTIVEQAVI